MSTGTTPYEDLWEEDQVDALRPLAVAAAEEFGLEVADVDLVLHAYNTTFCVDTTDGRRVALRVGTNSKSTPANVVAQQAWQRAITQDTDVHVPDPLQTPSGDWFVRVPSEVLGRDALVTGASWLEGEDARDGSSEWAHELGRAMATLHRHAAAWSLPEGAELPLFDTPLLGDEDLLTAALADIPGASEVLAEASTRSAASFAALHADATPIALHADLHGGNLKWHDGRLSVFDFDDSGMGMPLLDLAISTFYVRRAGADGEPALRAGYASVAPLPDGLDAHLEPLVAARQLLLANSLLDSSTAALRAQAQDYLHVTVARLRHWLDTGRFVLDPPPSA
ncbi:phosphotransferase enzyme family protein [Oryzobacter telluris]|uniref:phosphotransferase enzyme family protein n=1 Tax=Oryzobacter telluris TaxID=3149179 RepID=UPI00370D4990